MKALTILTALGGFGWAAAHMAIHLPTIPSSIAAPAGQHVARVQVGRGTQNYVCQANGATTGYDWVFKAPQADLFDGSTKVATHFAGPSWEAPDGSKVVGSVQAKSPSADSIPWLLLNAKSVSGSGLYGQVTSVQRLSTQGGLAPTTGCQKTTLGKEVEIAYSALYVFYEAGDVPVEEY